MLPGSRAPVKREYTTEVTAGTTSTHRRIWHRLNPLVFVTICSTLCILMIAASLVVLTLLPIFSPVPGNQTKYQVQSDALTLTYNLPDRFSIQAMNWTYVAHELDVENMVILQKLVSLSLLQSLLDRRKITEKTSITVIDAFISSPRLSSNSSKVHVAPSVMIINGSITITADTEHKTSHSLTPQLLVTLMLRYALECTTKCQHNLRESIFVGVFRRLELSMNTFQRLFIQEFQTYHVSSGVDLPTTGFSNVYSASTATPPRTMPIVYEAEAALNIFPFANVQLCAICSGHRKVANIGFNAELVFEQIFRQRIGSTLVVLHYTTDQIRFAQITVNNSSRSMNVTFPLISTHRAVDSLPLTLDLCQGFNSIRIYNPHAFAPDFDRIVVH